MCLDIPNKFIIIIINCMNGRIQVLVCPFDKELVPLPLDVCSLAFYYIFVELFEFELVFRNFFGLGTFLLMDVFMFWGDDFWHF